MRGILAKLIVPVAATVAITVVANPVWAQGGGGQQQQPIEPVLTLTPRVLGTFPVQDGEDQRFTYHGISNVQFRIHLVDDNFPPGERVPDRAVRFRR